MSKKSAVKFFLITLNEEGGTEKKFCPKSRYVCQF